MDLRSVLCSLPGLMLLWGTGTVAADGATLTGTAGTELRVERTMVFNEPWAMTFLPDSGMLVTEKSGKLLLIDKGLAAVKVVGGLPEVAYGGQGGLGDVILDPRFTANRLIYLSYAESDRSGKRGAVVIRARLAGDDQHPVLEDLQPLWRQVPKTSGSGHYSHRLAFGPDGMLYITSGDRQQQEPAQDWSQNLGKIIRLNPDGSVPPDNPFQNRGELAKTFWTLGHRNMLGLAFDESGRLWANEMGPRHGDEFNVILAGENYGWPLVSWGDHYSGISIPDHDTRPEFKVPAAYWVPTIAPSGLIIYNGRQFPEWRGNALMGGLASRSLIRVQIEGDTAKEVERFNMGKRIREVEQGPEGAVWLLEDQEGGALLKLSPPE